MKREQIKNITIDGVEYTPIKLGKLEVAQNDFPNRMQWKDAKKACADLGNGWRLPTKDELDLLYQYKDDIGNMKEEEYEQYYWSSTSYNKYYAWFQDFINGYQFYLLYSKSFFHAVRAVRDIK